MDLEPESGPQEESPPRLTPVAGSARINSLDVLRGFALLGILVMNIQSFAMVGAAYMNPTAYGDLTGANYGVFQPDVVLVAGGGRRIIDPRPKRDPRRRNTGGCLQRVG